MNTLFKQILNRLKGTTANKLSLSDFELDLEVKVPKRRYSSYQEYLKHQAGKLHKKLDQIKEFDKAYEDIVYERYKDFTKIGGKSIICLAARLGGEVRAFKRLGALAIGIDIEPGPQNPHVVYGDFHQLMYPNCVFDFAFCNAIDHVLDLPKFLVEVKRVLKDDGIFILEIAEVNPGEYEALDTSDLSLIIEYIEKYFTIHKIEPIKNIHGFVNWSGKMLVLQKASK